jgi:hypothetical protein
MTIWLRRSRPADADDLRQLSATADDKDNTCDPEPPPLPRRWRPREPSRQKWQGISKKGDGDRQI